MHLEFTSVNSFQVNDASLFLSFLIIAPQQITMHGSLPPTFTSLIQRLIHFPLFNMLNFLAFLPVIIFLPVLLSISFLALPATLPPSTATYLFSGKSFGFFTFDISVVAVSASIFKTNSKLVILSRKFSFFKSLNFL